MRIGTFCFATSQGLGVLAKDFYDEGVVTDALMLRHRSWTNRPEWYPDSAKVNDVAGGQPIMRAMCDSVDVMLFFETPFDWTMIDYCRQKGVKTALMVMYECEPANLPVRPDLILCPSLLDLSYYPNGKHLPVPVPRSVKWRQRTRAEVFVHNAGHGGLKGRNGTGELIEATEYLKTPAKIIIRSQNHFFSGHVLSGCGPEEYRFKNPNVEVRIGDCPYDSLFQEGDVFVFPEKFNGLSLPLQEARAAGMLVMGTDRFPMNMWLPREPLIPVESYRKNRIGGCNEFDEAVLDPRAIAVKIDEWYGRDITDYSLSGKMWAEENSWDVLKTKYLEVLEGLVKS